MELLSHGISGNIFSIKKAYRKIWGTSIIINKPSDFDKADKIVIPGVGSFKDAMHELNRTAFIEKIQSYDKPILGICLGMQILVTR